MNNRLKFRAYCKDRESMFYNIANLSINKPIMQFIGLKDNSGQDIYEDDILEAKVPRLGVRYIRVSSAFSKNCDCCYRIYGYSVDGFDDCKVVGNVHETPELLDKCIDL